MIMLITVVVMLVLATTAKIKIINRSLNGIDSRQRNF